MDEVLELVALGSAGNRSTRSVVHAQDQQFVEMPLVSDAERRHSPTADASARAKDGDGSVELAICQAFDAPRDLSVRVRGGGRVTFVEIGDRCRRLPLRCR
jgi:hypothetical protein